MKLQTRYGFDTSENPLVQEAEKALFLLRFIGENPDSPAVQQTRFSLRESFEKMLKQLQSPTVYSQFIHRRKDVISVINKGLYGEGNEETLSQINRELQTAIY